MDSILSDKWFQKSNNKTFHIVFWIHKICLENNKIYHLNIFQRTEDN